MQGIAPKLHLTFTKAVPLRQDRVQSRGGSETGQIRPFLPAALQRNRGLSSQSYGIVDTWELPDPRVSEELVGFLNNEGRSAKNLA